MPTQNTQNTTNTTTTTLYNEVIKGVTKLSQFIEYMATPTSSNISVDVSEVVDASRCFVILHRDVNSPFEYFLYSKHPPALVGSGLVLPPFINYEEEIAYWLDASSEGVYLYKASSNLGEVHKERYSLPPIMEEFITDDFYICSVEESLEDYVLKLQDCRLYDKDEFKGVTLTLKTEWDGGPKIIITVTS